MGGFLFQATGYFVHSIYNLLQAPPINGGPRQGAGPPTALFNAHREWFWPRDAGPAVGGQVCWTNASLVAQLILATKAVLRAQPDARIMVSPIYSTSPPRVVSPRVTTWPPR